MRQLRNAATWVTMSFLTVLLVDGRVGLLPVNFAALLFVFVFLGVGVAAGCQVWMWVASLWSYLGISEAFRLFSRDAAQEEAERFPGPPGSQPKWLE